MPWGQSCPSLCHQWLAQRMEHKNHFVKVRLYLIRRWIHSTQPYSENEYGMYIKHLVYIIISRKKLLVAYVKLPTTQLTMSWTLLSDSYAILNAWDLFLVACIWINWLSPFKMTPLQVSQGGRQRGSLGAQESLGFEHLGSNWFLLHTSHSASKLLNLTMSPFLIILMSQSCCKGLLVIGKSIKYIISIWCSVFSLHSSVFLECLLWVGIEWVSPLAPSASY